eukprot:scaffold2353_cov167-Amphora_coffeaeformis.AAC.51
MVPVSVLYSGPRQTVRTRVALHPHVTSSLLLLLVSLLTKFLAQEQQGVRQVPCRHTDSHRTSISSRVLAIDGEFRARAPFLNFY